MAKGNTLPDPWSKEQMEKWKNDKDLVVYTCILEQGEPVAGVETTQWPPYQFAFKSPSWEVFKLVASAQRQGDNVKAGEIILNNCWLAGHDQIKSDPAVHLGACFAAINMLSLEVPSFKATLVKP